MKKIILGLALLVACNVSYATEKVKKKTTSKTDVSSAQQVRDISKTAEQVQWLESINSNLGICKVWLVLDEAALRGKISYIRAESNYNKDWKSDETIYDEAKAATLSDSKFATCESDARAKVANETREFIKGLVEPALQSKARDVIAQWLTAMDAVRQSNFEQEQSKFKALLNNLKLDLTIG